MKSMKRILILFLMLNSTLIFAQKSGVDKQELMGLSYESLIEMGYITPSKPIKNSQTITGDEKAEDCSDAFIPVEPDYIAVPRNDDGSLYIPDIGFEFSFCGSTYTDLYINTNGNLSFTQGVSQFSPDGFPYPVPMVAPFWGDVDTRNANCGQAHYKLFGNYMIVSWVDVGWYNQQCSPLNTFQVIISDGTAPIIGVGNNVQFRYEDMEWTTGQASGGGPFGGSPATVGFNSGDNENFEQLGRFNVDSDDYDGPYGANDGVHWLDFKCFIFDANPGGPFDLSCSDGVFSLDNNCSLTLLPEDVGSYKVNGCETVTATLDKDVFGCSDIGDHIVTITVSNDSNTETCSAMITIVDGACTTINIPEYGPYCDSDDPVTLNANPPGGTWSGATSNGVFDPELLGVGTHLVYYTENSACPPTDSIEIVVEESPTVVIIPGDLELCASEDPTNNPLTAEGVGGDNNYIYSWDTPFGLMSGSTVFPQESGTYTVTVEDGNLCQNTASVEVIINPDPMPEIEPIDPICQDVESFQFTATPEGGTFGGSNVDVDGTIYPEQNAPGTYIVNYSYEDENGCFGFDEILYEITDSPLAFADATTPVCEGDIIGLFGDSDANDANAIYSWTGPNGYTSNQQNPIDPTDAGIYYLQVETSEGCLSNIAEIEVVLVEAPVLTMIGSSIGCDATETQIFVFSDVNDVDYEWSGPNNFSSNQSDPLVPSIGMYYVTVSAGITCTSIDSVEVIADSTPPDITAAGNSIDCIDTEATLSANSNTNNVSYQWSGPNGFSSDEQFPLVSDLGPYTVVVTGPNGCKDSMSVELTSDAEYAMVTIPTDTLQCSDESLQLMPQVDLNPVTYNWDGPNGFNSQEENPSITQPGDYTLTVTSSSGCETIESVTIASDTLFPVIEITFNDINCIQAFSEIVLSGNGPNDSVSWTGPNGFSSNESSFMIDVPGDYSVEVTSENGCTSSDMISIESDQSLASLSATSDTISCTTGSAVIYGLTDVDGAIVTWQNELGDIVGNEDTISVGVAGIYFGIVEHPTSGCLDTTQIEVFQDVNVPDLSASGTTINCLESNFFISASSQNAISLEWEGPNNFSSDLANPEITEAGTYTITATSQNGCKAVEMVEVIDDTEVPTILLNSDIIDCNNPQVNILVQDTGDGNNYSWSGPNNFSSNSKEPNIDMPGIYELIVTSSNGCSSMENIEVIADLEEPSLSIDKSNDLSCEEPTAIISSSTNVPDGSYEWNGPNNFSSIDQDIEINTPGTYEVIVTASNGCSNMQFIEIELDSTSPQAIITGDVLNCYNNSIVLETDIVNGSNPSISWSGPNNYSSNDEDPTISEAGDYTITIINDNGCEISQTISIFEDYNEPQTSISVEPFDCDGNNAVLSSTLNGSGYSFEWTSESGNVLLGESVSISEEGDYVLIVTDLNNGCSSESTINVEDINPVSDFEYTSVSPGCLFDFGSVSILNVSGGESPLQYSIDGGNTFQTSPDFQNLNPGSYNIVVQDANGCETENVFILEELPQLELTVEELYIIFAGHEQVLEVVPSVDPSLVESVTWTPSENLSCDDCLNPIFSSFQNGIYTVEVVDVNGCRATANIEIRVLIKDLYIPNAFSPNGDNVNDQFTIFGDVEQVNQIEKLVIFDRWGNKVFYRTEFDINDLESGWNGTFDGELVVPGVYIYSAEVSLLNGDTKQFMGDVTVIR